MGGVIFFLVAGVGVLGWWRIGCRWDYRGEIGIRTLERKLENGRPPSLAKDQICRDAVAISAITAQTIVMIIMAVIVLAPA